MSTVEEAKESTKVRVEKKRVSGGDGVPKPGVDLEAQKARIIKVWEGRQAAFEKKWRLNSGGACNWLLDGEGKANCVRNGILYSADYAWVARSSVVRYTPQADKSRATDALYMWQWTRQWETDGEPDGDNAVPRRAPKLDAKEFDTDARGSRIPIPQRHWTVEKMWRLGLCAHRYRLETFITETDDRTTYYIGLSNLSRSTLPPAGTATP